MIDGSWFQPTLPLRGATSMSLHILSRASASFNPRSPCGERPGETDEDAVVTWFQPTLPLRGATCA